LGASHVLRGEGLKEGHEEVGRVGVGGAGAAEVSKEINGVLGGAEVGDFTLDEEVELVKEGEDLGRGLVDGADDSVSFTGQLPEGLDQEVGGGGVEARGGLVQEQEPGVGDELVANGRPLPLTTGKPTHQMPSNTGVGTRGHLEFLDDVLDHFAALVGRHIPGQPEAGGEREELPRGQHLEEAVVLHHVRRDLVEVPKVDEEGRNEERRSEAVLLWKMGRTQATYFGIFLPLRVTFPLEIFRRLDSALRSEVLPPPEGPMMARSSPASATPEISLRICFSVTCLLKKGPD